MVDEEYVRRTRPLPRLEDYPRAPKNLLTQTKSILLNIDPQSNTYPIKSHVSGIRGGAFRVTIVCESPDHPKITVIGEGQKKVWAPICARIPRTMY